jgi:polar amino acid transport system substrate-binding protein
MRRIGGLPVGLTCVALVVLVAASGPSMAQPAPEPAAAPIAHVVKVGINFNPPFVMKQGSGYSGMAIELWQKIAARLGLISEYREFHSPDELIAAVSSGKVDAGIANLGITTQRAEKVDFTQPWFDAGLRVMVHTNGSLGFTDVVRDMRDAGHLANFAWILLGILAATVLITIVDRRYDKEFHPRWREGLAENFRHVISLAVKGETKRKNTFGWAGSVVQGLWLLFSVGVIAYVASAITSVMTASHIANRISSVSDLQGKVVGVRRGSMAADVMPQYRVKLRNFDHVRDAAEALTNREIAAVVDDNPVLEYFAHMHPDLPLDVVGSTFHPDSYGFAFAPGSALTKPVSLQIIELQEDGGLEKLRSRYFGFKP